MIRRVGKETLGFVSDPAEKHGLPSLLPERKDYGKADMACSSGDSYHLLYHLL